MGGWKIEHMDIVTNYLGRLTNHDCKIKINERKVKKIMVVV